MCACLTESGREARAACSAGDEGGRSVAAVPAGSAELQRNDRRAENSLRGTEGQG